jgi:hypothetical protein
LDLVPIAAKLLSRPGAYDILVEHSEFTANANWADFSRHFAEEGNGWPGRPLRRGEVSLADASLLLRPHYREPRPRPEPVVSLEPSEGETGAVAADKADCAVASEDTAVGNGIGLVEARDGLPDSVEKAEAV